jgi:hypothetical protein
LLAMSKHSNGSSLLLVEVWEDIVGYFVVKV